MTRHDHMTDSPRRHDEHDRHDERLHDDAPVHDERRHDGFIQTPTYIIHTKTKAILDIMPNAFIHPELPHYGLVPLETALITRINVPARSRGERVGSRLLSLAIHQSECQEIPLSLVPVSSGGLSQDSLEKWYEKNGFIPLREDRLGLWVRML